MTSTDLAVAGQQPTTLSIAPDQSYWTEGQVAALRHMGVEDASPGDLGVFFHVVKRTGLDPFARQIHMVGRNSKNQRTNQWETKYTIQTGIDGYRLIGRRAADHARVKVSVTAPEWAHEDGTWRPVWSSKWGFPVAARVTIHRDGEPFTAVAMFDEYKQTTKRDGGLNSMWSQRPAGQIAKCAEALAWRMAFPQDLAGVYVEDEMHHAANPERTAPAVETPRVTAADFTRPAEDIHDAEVEPDEPQPAPQPDDAQPITAKTRAKMFALLTELGITDADRQRAGMSHILGRTVESRASLTESEAVWIVAALEARKAAQDGGEQR